MKFWIYFQKTPLHLAVEKENADIVRLLLSHPKIDVNTKSIKINYFLNIIQYFIDLFHLKIKHINIINFFIHGISKQHICMKFSNFFSNDIYLHWFDKIEFINIK